uniref:Reverse transcriptase domain-containing protein n=1 Tax=Ascaris lumbricoides TaxID=6252 RepID=A0A9J2PQR3_ASCLU
MSAGIRQVAGLTKARLEKYLLQVKAPDLNRGLSEQLQTYEHQRSQIEAAINLLSDYERQWLQLFANLTPEQEKKERDLTAKAQETGGFLNRVEQGREQLIILQNYVLQLHVAIANQTESDARTHPNSTVSSSPLRLPKTELRTFDGNSTNWPVFWDWYLSTIDNQPISDQQKIAYFASCMVGPAKELIEAYQLQNPSYNDIVKRVKERYANNEVTVQQLYAQIERIPRIQEGRQVRRLVEDIERILELLLHQGETINNRMIQREIEKKLPRWILQDLERKKLEDDSWDVTKLRKFLSNVALTQEAYAPSQLLKYHFIENWASLPTVACGDPKILIGMDQLSKIMEVSTSKPMKIGFSIYETKLGPIIAGHGQYAPSQLLKHHFIENWASLPTVACGDPEILIGMDQLSKIMEASTSKPMKSGFSIYETKLGPIIAGHGQVSQSVNRNYSSVNNTVTVLSIQETDPVSLFWELEAIGIKDANESEDDVAQVAFQKMVSRESDGRICVGWPWKPDVHKPLSNNYGLCCGRLRSIWVRLQKNPDLLQKYHATFQEQEKRGIIEKAKRDPEHLEYFIPHQAVLNPDKDTTKIRIVFDASAKLRGTASLNEHLFRGPIILPDLVGLLLRWRTHLISITADLEKAFLQLNLRPQDREVTNFLWLQDIEKPPEGANIVVYRYTRVPFGIVSSPYLLAASIRHIMRDIGSPLAEEIMGNTYVDNVILEAKSVDEALQKYRKAKEYFASAQMNLREFLTNSDEVNALIPVEDKNKPGVLGMWTANERGMCDTYASAAHQSTSAAVERSERVRRMPLCL